MHLTRRHPKALPRLAGDPGKQCRRVMGVQPVQRPSQTVVVQQLRRDPRTQQVLHGFGRKELRDQIQPAIAEAEPVEDHGHRRRSHAHLLLVRSRPRIQIRRQPDLLAHARHDAQMIQPLAPYSPVFRMKSPLPGGGSILANSGKWFKSAAECGR